MVRKWSGYFWLHSCSRRWTNGRSDVPIVSSSIFSTRSTPWLGAFGLSIASLSIRKRQLSFLKIASYFGCIGGGRKRALATVGAAQVAGWTAHVSERIAVRQRRYCRGRRHIFWYRLDFESTMAQYGPSQCPFPPTGLFHRHLLVRCALLDGKLALFVTLRVVLVKIWPFVIF